MAVPLKGWKALEHSTEGNVLNVVRSSYEIIQNSVGWDIVDAIVGEGAKYETGITLKDGAVCLVTAWLDEPVTISGDDSVTLPYLVVRWTHDGSGSLVARSTSVRVVCANTDEASAAEARRNKTEFVFRHTKHVSKRIEDAKLALRGVRDDFAAFTALSEELARIPVTREQRELFVTSFLPMPPEALISDRVVSNVETARAAVRNLFNGPTIPEAHKLTAYGLRLAGIEYLDHLRGYRSTDTYVGRQLLRTEPAKVKLTGLIKEVVKA
jgi:phage/plasmid-like protein (TIGR03299 family)